MASATDVLWGLSVLSMSHVVFPLEISAEEVLVCMCIRAVTCFFPLTPALDETSPTMLFLLIITRPEFAATSESLVWATYAQPSSAGS